MGDERLGYQGEAKAPGGHQSLGTYAPSSYRRMRATSAAAVSCIFTFHPVRAIIQERLVTTRLPLTSRPPVDILTVPI